MKTSNIKRASALLGAGALVVAALVYTGPVQAQPSPAPAARAQHLVTEADFKRYYDLFNKGDTAYADFLADDIVYLHPSGKMIRTKAAYIEHYKNQPTRISDDRVPNTIVIDNERGRAAVELINHFWTKEGQTYTFENGTVIKGGEYWESSTVMFYEFNKDGKITSIKGAVTGPGPLKRLR